MRQQLIERLHEELGITKADAKRALAIYYDEALKSIGRTGEVKLPDLGKIVVKMSPERMARNPQTGDPVTIPAQPRARFRASVKLSKAVVDGLGEPFPF